MNERSYVFRQSLKWVKANRSHYVWSLSGPARSPLWWWPCLSYLAALKAFLPLWLGYDDNYCSRNCFVKRQKPALILWHLCYHPASPTSVWQAVYSITCMAHQLAVAPQLMTDHTFCTQFTVIWHSCVFLLSGWQRLPKISENFRWRSIFAKSHQLVIFLV